MDFLKVLIIILFIISTVITVQIHPRIHHTMVIEDSDFKLTRISDTVMNTVAEQNNTQQKIKPVLTQTIQNKQENIVDREEYRPKREKYTTVEIFDKVNNVKEVDRVRITRIPVRTQEISDNYVKPQKVVKPIPKEPEIVQKEIKKEVVQETPNALISKSEEELLKQILQGATQQLQEQMAPKQENNNPYMTAQEEIIAWNKWRSRVHNQVMMDSDAGVAPLGTMFMFSFVVDKYGYVSNVKVETSNPDCMDIAKYQVKPAITHLQGKPILNFPKGTQRTSIIVSGSFLIGMEDRFSTPGNFSDFERITY